MKYLLYISIVLVVVILVFYSGVFDRQEQRSSSDQQTEQQESGTPQKRWETRTDEQPPVTIKVTPIEFGGDVKTWRFVIVFDTHSGSLDEDLAQIATLTDDKGNIYQPTAWEGQGPGGHHREGVLVFNAINPAPMYVELKIKDIGDIAERTFRWNLE